jgi:hypothetical protein
VTASTASRLKSPANTPEAHEEGPRIGAQQVDAPLDRRLDGALALGDVAGRRDEQREHPVEPPSIAAGVSARMRARRVSIASGNALERPADACDVLGVVVGQLEARVGGAVRGHGTAARRRRAEMASMRGPRRVGRQRRAARRRRRARRRIAQSGAARHEERRVGQVVEQPSRRTRP